MKAIKFLIAPLVAIISLSITGCSTSKKEDPAPIVVPEETGAPLTAVSPGKGLPHSAITIKGNNFSTDLSKLKVTFNGVAATVYTATATELVVEVPPNAKSGKIKVLSDGVAWVSPTDFAVVTATQSFWADFYGECITIDNAGDIYASDYHSIFKGNNTTAGTLAKMAGATNIFDGITGIVKDASGNIFAADESKKVIYKITPAGVVSVFAGGVLNGQIDGQGTAATFLSPESMVIDGAGVIYIADGPRVRKITPGGLVSTFAGNGYLGNIDGNASTARFGNLKGIALSPAGDLYVTDMDNRNIRKISPSGMVSTVAGTGAEGFVDGPAKSATFSYPTSIALDNAGNMFIATLNPPNRSAIRMINTAGYVSTFLNGTTLTTTNGPISSASSSPSDAICFDAKGNLFICYYSTLNKITFN